VTTKAGRRSGNQERRREGWRCGAGGSPERFATRNFRSLMPPAFGSLEVARLRPPPSNCNRLNPSSSLRTEQARAQRGHFTVQRHRCKFQPDRVGGSERSDLGPRNPRNAQKLSARSGCARPIRTAAENGPHHRKGKVGNRESAKLENLNSYRPDQLGSATEPLGFLSLSVSSVARPEREADAHVQ